MPFQDPKQNPKLVTLNPDGSVPVGDNSGDSGHPFQEMIRLLGELLLETRATRLAVETLVNDGAAIQDDFLELARMTEEEDEEN